MNKIAFIYGKKDAADALHTKEVLENELHASGISYTKKRNQLVLEFATIYFINLEREEGFENSRISFDQIFATSKTKKKNEKVLSVKTSSLHDIPYPSQAIVDVMLYLINLQKIAA